jgi:hypothetical protein
MKHHLWLIWLAVGFAVIGPAALPLVGLPWIIVLFLEALPDE